MPDWSADCSWINTLRLDMISFGPTMIGVHSPDERLLIPTVEKFWIHLLDVLANIPEKKQ